MLCCPVVAWLDCSCCHYAISLLLFGVLDSRCIADTILILRARLSTLTRAGILAGDFQAPPSLKQSPLSASSTMGYATETASHLLSTFWAKLGYR